MSGMIGHMVLPMQRATAPDAAATHEALCSIFSDAARADLIAVPETLAYRRTSPEEIEWRCSVRQPWVMGRVEIAKDSMVGAQVAP